MEPLNYSLDVLSPFQAALGGYAAAQQQAQARQGMAIAEEENRRANEAGVLAQQQFGLQRDQFGLAQQELAWRQSMAAQEQARLAEERAAQERAQQALVGLYTAGAGATPDMYLRALAENPAYAEQITQVFNGLSEGAQAGAVDFATQLFAATINGPDYVRGLLEERKAAAENAGDMATAVTAQSYLQMLDAPNGLDTVRAVLGLTLAGTMGGDAFKAAMQTIAPEAQDGDIYERERQIRQEYTQRTADYRAVLAAYDRLAAAQPTAAGDLSLIFNYMKMLDPGSTVREGEFANAQNATGIEGRIINLYNNVIRGERLSTEQRQEFMSQAQGLAVAAQQSELRAREALMPTVTEYGLEPSRVFSPVVDIEAVAPEGPATGGTPAPTTAPPATAPTSGPPPSFVSDPNVIEALRQYPDITIEDLWANTPAEVRQRYGG